MFKSSRIILDNAMRLKFIRTKYCNLVLKDNFKDELEQKDIDKHISVKGLELEDEIEKITYKNTALTQYHKAFSSTQNENIKNKIIKAFKHKKNYEI